MAGQARPRLLFVNLPRIERLFAVAEFKGDRSALAERYRAVKARTPAGVTGAGARLLDLQPERVLIAIDAQFNHALDVAGTLALFPQCFARAAVVPGLAACDGIAQGLGVHVRDHQHVAGAGVGGDRGDQPVGAEFGRKGQALLDLGGRATRRK